MPKKTPAVPTPGQSGFFEMPAQNKPDDLSAAPLAARMRPRTLDEIVGQQHILAEGKLLRRTVQSDRFTSMIFYGPPGAGKTTLARVISSATESHFVPLNAVTSNAAEIRQVLSEAQARQRNGSRTILFLDEIHRFNKAQQDILMPDVERGTIVLIGATTHNPSFAINGPLLSRSTIFELRPHQPEDLVQLMKRAIQDQERGFGKLKIKFEDEALMHIATVASGDARRALNALEVGVLTTAPDAKGFIHLTLAVAEESCQRRLVHYDKDEDYHYDTISAFIKSVRGSDPDAAIYWLAKMLYAGEDPRFIVRRLLILASEDIGNADPRGIMVATAGMQAVEFVGMPEARIILAQVTTYLAVAPKSNASYVAISEAMHDVESGKTEEVPGHLRDAHYKGADKLGHGKGYRYPHDDPGAVKQAYISNAKPYYRPVDSGYEKQIKVILDNLRSLRER